MVVGKINSSKIFSYKFSVAASIASISVSTLLFMLKPVFAGPQSLLDPYASVQPTATQAQTKPLGDRTSAKKLNNRRKLKSAKAPKQSTASQISSTTNSASKNPGFLSGIKEIQHGSVTSFKAAGHGIINGSKSAGATIAAGGGKVKDGFSAVGHKIMPGPKTKVAKTPHNKKPKQSLAAANSSAFTPRPSSTLSPGMPEMPGKPLGAVGTTLPHPAKVKPPKYVAKKDASKKQNLVARTFDKFNIFGKHKSKTDNLAANNQKTGG